MNFLNKYKMWIFGIFSALLFGFIVWIIAKAKAKAREASKKAANEVIPTTETTETTDSRGLEAYLPKNFKISEFDSPDVKGSGKNMQVSTLKMLDIARDLAGIPFKINSGYRTAAKNASLKNSVKNSSHLVGLAADIACTAQTRDKMLKALYTAGFRRFGIGNSYIHADNDSSKTANAVWGYPNTSYTLAKIAAL